MLCARCGAPIHWSRKAGGYLHAEPLALLRVSRWEAQDIHADPPRAKEPLHRQTRIHLARP